jgi:geranylgeranyl diphosphate synthase type II
VFRVHQALGGDDRDAAIAVAAAFELLHTALVAHDDIIDRDWSRRGRPNVGGHYREKATSAGLSPNDAEHHGTSAAIIAGDLALAGALRLTATAPTSDDRRRRLLDIMDDAVIASAIGELADIENPLAMPATAAVIARTHHAKTAVYTFEAPLQAGAVLAGASDDVIDRLGELGRHLGIAYQILDDIAGILDDEHATGKPSAGDFRSAKQTAVTVHARNRASWQEISHLFGERDITPAELAQIRRVLITDGAIEETEADARRHNDSARTAWKKLPSPLRRRLAPLLDAATAAPRRTDGFE